MKNIIPRLTRAGELSGCENEAASWNPEDYSLSAVILELERLAFREFSPKSPGGKKIKNFLSFLKKQKQKQIK